VRRAVGPPVVPITPVVPGEPGPGGGTEPGVPGWPVIPPEINIGTPEMGAPGLPETPWVPPGYVFVPPTIEIPEGSTVVILPPGAELPPGAVVLPPDLPGVPPGSVVVILPPGVEPPAGSVEVTPVQMPEVPRVEIPPIEVPRIEVPPVRVEMPRIEVPRVVVPPVEVPKVEIPQMPDVLSDLRRLVTNTLFNFDLPRLKDILGLFPDPMLKVYTVRNFVPVTPNAVAPAFAWWYPPSGYRFIMVGPIFVESEYYDPSVTVGIAVDEEWITQEGGMSLASSFFVDVPARYFVRGEEIYVAFLNPTDLTFRVWFTFLVVAATQEYYERWWAPLVRHTYESVKWTVDWFVRG